MSTVKEQAKQLIDQLPDEAVIELLEDLGARALAPPRREAAS